MHKGGDTNHERNQERKTERKNRQIKSNHKAI